MKNHIPIMILAMAGPLLGQVSFEKDVWPVFEARCVECHRKPYEEDGRLKKPKAGLRLDGAWHIMRGSDDGPIVVAERLDASTLYHHITLPSDDDDIMPPKGAPLSKSQIQSIGDWILDGASFGDWTGATDGVVLEKAKDQYVPKHVVYFKSLENGLEPLPESLSTQLSKVSSASIRRLHPESPLLDVGFFTTPNEIGDQQLAQLMGLREHVTKLSLARTGVTDKSVSLAGQFPHLSYL
ncbi:MAG: c-type cytochrome domain-containing protein, partial [Opitutae bacterium]